jgi:hypothetical protein
MRVLVGLLAVLSGCADVAVPDDVVGRAALQVRLREVAPRGLEFERAERRLQADGFTCSREVHPSPDSPDTLFASICERYPADTAGRRPWALALVHIRGRIDTVLVFAAGEPR